MSHCLPAEPAWPEPPPARAPLPWQRLLGTVLLLTAGLLGSGPAWAQVAVNQILFPSNIGRALNATVTVDYTLTTDAGGVITVALPAELTASSPPPASGCVLMAGTPASVACTAPAGMAGDRSTLSFDVRGAQVGSFNLAASSGSSSASNTGTVRESGDITVAHTRLPSSTTIAIGEVLQFSFGPRVAAGGDALPSGAVLNLTDQLPTGFTVTAIDGGGSATCSSVASANSARTITCSINGPLTLAQLNAITITVTGSHGSAGSLVNVVSVQAQPSAYFDQDGSNNIANLSYTVSAGQADLEARGDFTSAAVVTGSTQTLTLVLRNNGPSDLPSGGRISITIPAGFSVNSLPAGCSGPGTGVVLGTPTALNCGTGPVATNASQSFVAPLTMPTAAGSGNFLLSTQPPASYVDPVAANNTLVLPWQAIPMGSGQAQVTLVNESSADGSVWVDSPATPAVVDASNNVMRWRLRITTPSLAVAPSQSVIGTLMLTDQLPGVLDVTSPGAPAPSHRTPLITVIPAVTAGSATITSCPNVAAGSNLLVCSFSNVEPGTTIDVLVTVSRPFFSSALHTNTATLTSPDAVLTGTTVDDAVINSYPRTDLAALSLQVTPATPRVGQAVQFTLAAQNLGPDQNEIAEFRMFQDLNTSVAGASVAYGDISASGTGMTCAVAATALSDEPALPAGFQRVRCTNTAAVARYATRTVAVTARVLKPAALPPSGTAYSGQTSTLRVQVPLGVCEYKTETSTNGLLSGACNDGPATSNNASTATFSVDVPLIDLQQRATRVLPAGQTSFSFGQPLRYRYRVQNNGPSRAEGVQMTARLAVPAGFTLSSPLVLNINGSPAETGYALDASKNSSVSCSQPVANADLVCQLHPGPASNWLDGGREVNFEVEFTQAGTSTTPVNFGNEALACGSETSAYEIYGACSRSAANNNNLAAVNDLIFPRTDLGVTKTTVTSMPAGINQPVVFNLVVRNNGADATQRIRVQDVLPANLELVTSGPDAPSLALGSFVTATPSTATGASLACTPTPATLTVAGQNQAVNCVIDAQPGPLGSGAFPGSSNATNTLTLRLVAVPKAGLFTGPYLSNLNNTAGVQVGLNASGSPLSLDEVPGNNTSTSTLQVANISLAGRVYNDRNGNGVQDGTSPTQDEGIGGVALTLTGTDSFGNTISRSTTTQTAAGATRGDYGFSDLPSGTYTVTQTQPAGWLNGSATPPAPSAGGTYTAAASATTSVYSAVTLAPGVAATGYEFPEALPASVVSGTVFIDRDRNGLQGPGEPGIAGVTLALFPAGTTCPASGALPANPLQTVLTDASGAHVFAPVPPGVDYVLCQQQPTGYGDATPVPGTGNTTPGANQISIAALPASGSPGNAFPERVGGIGGTVFVDANGSVPSTAGNGMQDAGEPGLGSVTPGAGVPVTLTGTLAGSGAAIAPQTATTAADGSFNFSDLLAGTYTLTQGATPAALGVFNDGINTPGAVSGGGTPGTAGAVGDNAVRNIVLAGGASSNGNTFAELPAMAISGSVYIDANNDGVRQPAEGGYANQSIVLTGTDDLGRPVNTTLTTDASGNFAAANLRPGTYTLTQPVQPAGSSNGITTPGSAGGTATPVSTVPSVISGVTLVPGQVSTGNLFGEISSAPDMVVTQTLTPTTFTELNPGSYTLTVGNAGQVPTSGSYTVTNTLPAGITPVGAARGNGWACSASGQVVSCSSSTPIPAAGISGSPITLDVTVAGNACASFPCTLTNVVSVTGGGEPATSAPTPAELATPPQCSGPQPTQNACRVATPVQQSGGVSGTVWLDVDHDRQLTSTDVRQAGFIVELVLNGQLQRSTSTDARGDYMLTGLVPGSGYEIRFKDPATGAYYGRPISADPAGGNDPTASGPASVVMGGSIRNLSIPGGNAMRVNQNLPLDPNGVVYDSVTRQPVNGAVVELLTPGGDPVPAQCVLGGVNRITTAITGAGVVPGGYAFWLANPQPAGCAGDGAYQLRVTPPAGYLNAGRPSDGSLLFTSVLLPATGNLASVPGSCQGYVAGSACAIQAQSAPPTGNQPTPYYFRLPLTPATPVAFVEIINNHIPLDPFGGTRFVITKQAAARTADVGDTMRYTITVRHIAGPQLPNVRVDDVLPAGFRYIPGTFRLAGALQSDPAGGPGPKLSFPLGTLPVNGQFTFSYFLRVGVGSQQGDGINSAQGVSVSGAQQVVSNIARAQVKVTGGVFSNEACVLGKVFVDCNGNMVQDREELGIPGVRLFLQDGTGLTTDSEGKYSHCGLPPRTQVLKVDPLTLPRGSRLVTSSSRNAGDANSLFLDLKNGELQRADFIEGSCSNTVLEQVKARRAQGEVRSVETEAKGAPALKFEGKAPGYAQQGTDSANQPPVKPRVPAGRTDGDSDPPPAPVQPSRPEQNVPVPQLPAASQNTQRK